ncbi:MAG TPA: hypothetical protein VD837_03850 [Terriglobales bacterium]|nr:hypothetical protein [Terriglobales bacterium]
MKTGKAARLLPTASGNPVLGTANSASPPACIFISDAMDLEKTIIDIELLERIYSLPDKRPLTSADRAAANQKHDEMNADNPWFRLWRRYGV